MKLLYFHLGYQYVILNYFSWIFQLTSKESQYLQNAVEEKSTTHPCAQRRVFSLLCVIDDSSFGPTSSSWLARRVVNLTNIYIYTHKTHTNKSQHSPCSSILSLLHTHYIIWWYAQNIEMSEFLIWSSGNQHQHQHFAQ